MKRILLKVTFVIIAYILLQFGYVTVKPMVIADSAVLQLQDSDIAYSEFKGVQRFFDYYWILYLLPMLIFTKDIKKMFNSKGENK